MSRNRVLLAALTWPRDEVKDHGHVSRSRLTCGRLGVVHERGGHECYQRLAVSGQHNGLAPVSHLADEVRQLRPRFRDWYLPHDQYGTTVRNVQKVLHEFSLPVATRSTTSGSLADGIATTAMPLLLVGLTTDPVLVALLQVALGLPWLMFSLHVGVLVDRLDRRTILWVADASRAAVAALLVLLVVIDAVSVPVLLAVAFLEGPASVVFRAMLPSLVARDDLARASGHIQTGLVVTGGFVGTPGESSTYLPACQSSQERRSDATSRMPEDAPFR